MSDWAKTLLADVARETIAEADGVTAETYPNLYAKEFPKALAVLERRLLGLLEAGQAMWDKIDSDGELGRTKEWEAWDAAKVNAVRP